MKNLEQAFVDYASSRTNEMGGKRFTLDYGPRSFNDTANTWKEKPNFNWAHTQTFTNPQGEIGLHPLLYDTEEEDVSSTNACNLNLGAMVKGKEGVKEQGKEENEIETNMEVDEVIEEEESEFETDEEVKEILKKEEDEEDSEKSNLFPTMEELTHHEWLLKNPRPL
ncbi:hypothetical protein Tco_0432804 [Tanacetum coccineum]